MENINFSLNEIEINKTISLDESWMDDPNFFYEDTYDMEQLTLYYNTHYTIKGLLQILQYYGIHKSKMVKDEMIQVLLFFETDPLNKFVVGKRLRLWSNIKELKADPYFSKYILF
jgi:hypothetical protein